MYYYMYDSSGIKRFKCNFSNIKRIFITLVLHSTYVMHILKMKNSDTTLGLQYLKCLMLLDN